MADLISNSALLLNKNERYYYGLETLTYHLYLSKQHNKLLSLFESDQWMHRRVSTSKYTYTGFLNDLEIAWTNLETMDKEEILASVKRFPEYVRLGLIASSISSLSKVPINLLVSAVSTRCWSIDRALSLIIRYSPAERVVALTGLLMLDQLELAERRKVQQQVYETVIATGNKIPVRHLTGLLPYLESNMAEEVIDRIVNTISLTIGDTPLLRQATPRNYEDERFYLDEALNLLHLLPAGKRDRIIQVVAKGILTEVKRKFRGTEKSKNEEKPLNLLQMTYEYMEYVMQKEFEDLTPYALHLQHLAPFLQDYPKLDEVLDQLVNILEVVDDADFYKQVICTYVPYFKRELMTKILRRTLILEKSELQREVLLCLAPHIDIAVVNSVLDTLDSSLTDQKRSIILNILAQHEEDLAIKQTKESNIGSDLSSDEVRLAEAQGNVSTYAEKASQESMSRKDLSYLFERLGPNFWKLFRPFTWETGHITDPEDPLKHTRTAKFNQLMPRDEEQKGYMSIGPTPYEIQNEWIRSITSYINDEPPQAALPILPSLSTESTSSDSKKERSGDAHDLLVNFLLKVGSPAFLTLYASQLPDEMLSTLIDEYFDADEMAFQVYLLDMISAKEIDTDRAAESQASNERIKGAMLKSALKYAYQHYYPLTDAWRTLPEELPSEADLSILLNFVLTLPTERERNAFEDGMLGEYANIQEKSPRLQALSLFVSHLKGDLLLKAFRSVLEIPDVALRRSGLDMLAPYLGRDVVTRALEVTSEITDAVEQSWALSTIISSFQGEKREQLGKWEIEVALQITNGRQLGILLAELFTQKTITLMPPDTLEYVLNNLSKRDPNNRLDILESLVQAWKGPVPPPILDAVLALPTVSERNLYSWRARAIFRSIDRFPEEATDKLWEAIQALPRRLNIGDAETWGWNWSYEYPFAFTIYILAPRLSGHMLEQAFEEAKQFYWTPREEIFQRLAQNADSVLAGKMLDFTLVMAEKYGTTALSSELLTEQEGAAVLGSMEDFRLKREVGCAETIAALAPKLNEVDLTKAVEKIWSFRTKGPRAWLTSKLPPFISEADLKRALPIATIDALEFIANDPTRYDLVTELLPYIRRQVEAEALPIRELIWKYFPKQDDLILGPEQRNKLSEEDQKRYMQMVEKYIPVQMKRQILGETHEESEDEQRKALEETILTPVIGSQLEQNIFRFVLISPLAKRLEALGELKTSLTEGQMEVVVTSTFDEVLQVEPRDEEELVKMLNYLIPYLPKSLHPKIIAVTLGLSNDTRKLTEEDLAEAVYGELLRDFAKRLNPLFELRPFSPLGALLDIQLDRDRFQESFAKLESNRVRLLEALIPYIDESLLADVVDAILQFKEFERIHGICVLMPYVEGDLKNRLYENTLVMNTAFGRAYILWRVQDHLDEEQRHRALPIAISAARMLKSKTHQAAALLTIMGFVDDIQRASILKLILETITYITNESDALKTLAIFTEMADSYPDLMENVLKFILKMSDSSNQMKGLVLFSRDNSQFPMLASKYAEPICSTIAKHLHKSSYLERNVFLTELANLLPVTQSLLENESKYLIAETLNEVCRQWRWL